MGMRIEQYEFRDSGGNVVCGAPPPSAASPEARRIGMLMAQRDIRSGSGAPMLELDGLLLGRRRSPELGLYYNIARDRIEALSFDIEHQDLLPLPFDLDLNVAAGEAEAAIRDEICRIGLLIAADAMPSFARRLDAFLSARGEGQR